MLNFLPKSSGVNARPRSHPPSLFQVFPHSRLFVSFGLASFFFFFFFSLYAKKRLSAHFFFSWYDTLSSFVVILRFYGFKSGEVYQVYTLKVYAFGPCSGHPSRLSSLYFRPLLYYNGSIPPKNSRMSYSSSRP